MRLHILEFSQYHLELVRNRLAGLTSAAATASSSSSFAYNSRIIRLAERFIEVCEIVESQDSLCGGGDGGDGGLSSSMSGGEWRK
eukprot:2061296-Rhodomonas_salina.1